jgi:hypothetical protein
MRFLTRSEVFRAFPELDRFSDERCRALLSLVYRSNRYNNLVGVAVLGGIILGLAFSISAGVLLQDQGLERVAEAMEDEQSLDWLGLIQLGVFTVILAAPPLLLAFLGRDIAMRFALKRAVRGHLSGTVCPECRYQLIGQRVSASGSLRCPECGRRTTIAELGLAGPEDLLPDSADDAVS